MSGKPQIRIAVFTDDDSVWALPVWLKTIPALQKKYQVVGLWRFPEQLGRLRGWQIPLYYLQVFGPWNVLLMGLFALKRKWIHWCSGLPQWTKLAKKLKVLIYRANSPNSQRVIAWVKEQEVDVILIMVGQILKASIISAPRIGIVNKHASMLPSCRGVLPFFWARVFDHPLGVSFHQVDEGIDSGRLLLQTAYRDPIDQPWSLVGFYKQVFSDYPTMACQAVENLVAGRIVTPDSQLSSGYYSFPTPTDYHRFKQLGAKIISLQDLWEE